jgi:hypothetical protein
MCLSFILDDRRKITQMHRSLCKMAATLEIEICPRSRLVSQCRSVRDQARAEYGFHDRRTWHTHWTRRAGKQAIGYVY